jgi:hypothetical protein
MIPKIIHACWLGSAPMPEVYKNYVEGWKKLNPDFEVKLWTDEDFKEYYDDSAFVRDALAKKKYGFLADYFRFTVLLKFGGVYIDTDVEMFKPIGEFMNSKMFMGYIFDTSIGTALIGSEPNNPIIKDWLDQLESDYDSKGDFTVSNDWITGYFLKHFKDFRLSGKRQSLECGLELYPKDYFERYQLNKKKPGGYAEHHCAGSWSDEKVSLVRRILKKILPRKIISYLGHKKKIRQTPYYNVYKKQRKEI